MWRTCFALVTPEPEELCSCMTLKHNSVDFLSLSCFKTLKLNAKNAIFCNMLIYFVHLFTQLAV